MNETLWLDLRYALRTLSRNPAFTAVALVILTLGIGATTAIFSVVDAVLLDRLPYEDSERLVRVRHAHVEHGFDGIGEGGGFSPQDFEDLIASSASYDALATYSFVPGNSTANLAGDGTPERLNVAVVSGRFFEVMGRPAAVGRTIGPEDAVEGKDAVVVLSHALWQRRFGGAPDVVGRSLLLDGAPIEVLGVMPPTFRYPSRQVDVWAPISRVTDTMIPHRRSIRWQQVLGRLAPGVTVDETEAEARAIVTRLAETYPDSNEGWTGAEVTPLLESMVGEVRPALVVLLGATALVLLVGCANLANLLLARGTGRAREIAVRLSLGANRQRLMRQLLTESLTLSVVGGVLGLALAVWGAWLLSSMSSGMLPRVEDVGLDPRMAAFALLASVLTGAVFGLIPAWTATAARPESALRQGSTKITGGRKTLRNALVAGEMAIAVILVIGCGLMLKSFWKLLRVDPGFETDRVLTLSITVSDDMLGGDDWVERLLAYQGELLDAVRQVPGVLAVGASKSAPLSGGGEPVEIETLDETGKVRVIRADSGLQSVTPGYFDALGITVLQGRTFEDRDPRTSIVVNQSLAERYWPGRSAVGQRLGTGDRRLEIVGVVADVRHEGVARQARSSIYVSPRAAPRSQMNLYIRTGSEPLLVAESVRQAIWSVNSDQPISNLGRLRQSVDDDVARPRLLTTLLAAFAVLALTLAAFGIYGVVSYTVGERTGEIGVRIALGAQGSDVVRLIVSQSLVVSLAGLALGLVGALWLSRTLSSLLYGVEPRDPSTFAVVAAVLVGVSLLASAIPALRASRIDPVSALRGE